MRVNLASFALAALMAPAAIAETPAEIEGVIGAQIEAFLADDFDTAFTYASPMIQGMFGNATVFGHMVEQGYPMVHRPADIRYLDLAPLGPRLTQKVMIRDEGGLFHMLEYELVETQGGWKINGVRVLEAARLGA